jgi:methylmalonyl-CoA/ethylmalonyl-CoA epimerase
MATADDHGSRIIFSRYPADLAVSKEKNMTKEIESVVRLPPVMQIGFAVSDVDRAIEYYSNTFGWGPFEVQNIDLEYVDGQGQPGRCHLKVAITNSGPIQIEIQQVLEGEHPIKTYIQERGEGINHLCFMVDDLNRIVSDLASEGIKPLIHGSLPLWENTYLNFACMDTEKIGGTTIELVQLEERGQPRG